MPNQIESSVFLIIHAPEREANAPIMAEEINSGQIQIKYKKKETNLSELVSFPFFKKVFIISPTTAL